MSTKKPQNGQKTLGEIEPPARAARADPSRGLGYGIELRIARVRAGLSQVQLGARLNLSGPTISAWESEAISPQINNLAKAAHVLDVDLADLVPSRIQIEQYFAQRHDRET